MRTTNIVDLRVGEKLRSRRIELRLTLATLAADLGLSTSQLQKFESGMERVSAVTLRDFCRRLRVEPSYFFEAILDDEPNGEKDSPERCGQPAVEIAAARAELSRRLNSAFDRVTSPLLRNMIADLVERITRMPAPDDESGDVSER